MGDHSELKRLATRIVEVQTSQDVPISKLFDDFDAATSPEVVLALIAENERLERLALDSVNAEYAGSMDLESICAERDQLRAEVAGIRTGYEAYEQVNAELKAEVEVLRKDSDKWKIVQRAGDQLLADEGRAAIWSACSRILISVASELNSGRSVVTEEGVTSGGVEIGDWRVTVERINGANQGVEPDLDTQRKDAERYRFLCEKFGETKLPCALERILAGGLYIADGKPSIDSAIDAALGQGAQS
ncbi:hypothetical protein [Pseudomonas sp. WMBT8]|uniref:hypothetical protein n=1 Tax=Pseudomonas sp. WMBT8 TaxID=3414496 RepID=UPI003D805713